jgi:DNA-binding IclR family transcriptional regulator
MANDTEDDDGIQSVKTALEILETLRENGPLRLTDIATEVDLAKSTAHRYLDTLESNNYLVREGFKYRISGRFIHYAEEIYNREPAYSMVEDKVKDLAQETGELVQFLIEEHDRVVYVFNEVGKQGIQIDTHAGQYGYLHSTAGGKAILSTWPTEKVNQLPETDPGLPAVTDHTITDLGVLHEELDEIRDQGYGVNDQENIVGVRAVAVPIRKSNGQAVGAISISGPTNRIRGELFETDSVG